MIDFTTTTATASSDHSATTRARRWSVITPPASYPVTWEDAKTHLRLDTNDDETYVSETLIPAAVDYAEEAMSSSLISRTLRATFYDGEPLVLPRGPLISITAVTDKDENDLAYETKAIGRSVQVIPTTAGSYPISIQYSAGYASANAIPAAIRLAILQHVATMYRDRESITDRERVIVPQALADFYRLHGRNRTLN